MDNEFLSLEEEIVKVLKTVFDPEIPASVYDLGLIYKVDISDDKKVTIEMTLTAPGCPAADFIVEDIEMKVKGVNGVTDCKVEIVFDPPWDQSMMSEEAKMDLGFL